ncbi:MAG: Dabb family protein [Verrucomicrobiota bacterium]|nr:Dabb family protein [Verrucomicrobiota bacterium]
MQAKIRHMVVFNLKAPKGDPAAQEFLEAARRMLAPIPFAKNIEQCRQINAMCPFDYGFSFDFDTPEDYAAYNSHPDHRRFVEDYWKTQVADFMEVDFETI